MSAPRRSAPRRAIGIPHGLALASLLAQGCAEAPLQARVVAPAEGFLGEPYCATVAHDGGGDASVVWTWGPGEEAGTGTRSCHVFPRPGEHRVTALVEARGQRALATTTVRVEVHPADRGPRASSTIAYDRTRGEVWVVNPDADSVTVLRGDGLAVQAEVPVGARPRTLALAGGVVAVTCQDDGSLWLLDAARRRRRATVRFGPGTRPYGVAADPRGGRFFVALQDTGTLALVDAATGAITARVDVGLDARSVAVNGAGLALVTRWRATAEGARVVAVDARTPERPQALGTTLLPRDVDLDSDTDNSGVPSFLSAVVFAPDGRSAVVSALKANIVTGTHRTGEALRADRSARAVYSELYLGAPGRPPMETWRRSLDDLDYASAAVWSPDGARIFLAIQGAEVVEVRNARELDSGGSIDLVGGAPQGLALTPDGRVLYVQGYSTRTVRAYDVRDLATPPRPLAEAVTVARERLAPQVLQGLQIFHRSRDPRMSRTSYLSCASCHMDGDSDNLVWDFTQRGEGLRNTISLLGRGGVAHGPLHWSANFDEVQDFEHDIRGGQGGAGFLSDAALAVGTRNQPLGDPKAGLSPELDALAAYVSSLTRFGASPHRRPDDPAWQAAFARGEAVFRRAGCEVCHAGPRRTDSAFVRNATPRLHDVGTLGAGSGRRLGGTLPGLDTPTLRGLWSSAPYLHDGSAATLREVLTTRNRDERHGRTRALAPGDLDDLETYLLALDDATP